VSDRVCSIDSCTGKVSARGWCNAHYLRWQNHGDPLGGKPGPTVYRVEDHDDGTRTCTACGQRLSLESFGVDRSASGGRRSHCKPCRSVRMKAWYAANQERQMLRARDRFARDIDSIRASDLRRYERNRAERIELAKASAHRRRIRLANTVSEPGITVAALRGIHGGRCPYCGVTMTYEPTRHGVFVPAKATIEHLVPLSRGGDHTFANTMLCCWQCNVRRNATPLEEWIAGGNAAPRGEEALRQD